MERSIKINIGGMIFQISEQAYDLLKDYLQSITSRLKNTPGGNEMIDDIEARIAEIFQQSPDWKTAVISREEVEEMINDKCKCKYGRILHSLGKDKAIDLTDDFVKIENWTEEVSKYDASEKELIDLKRNLFLQELEYGNASMTVLGTAEFDCILEMND